MTMSPASLLFHELSLKVCLLEMFSQTHPLCSFHNSSNGPVTVAKCGMYPASEYITVDLLIVRSL